MVRTRNDATASEDETPLLPGGNVSKKKKRSPKTKRLPPSVDGEALSEQVGIESETSVSENDELGAAREALPPAAFKQFAHLVNGVLAQANKNSHQIAERQMEGIQRENERAAERQRIHEDAMATRQRDDAERFAERQRIQTEANAQRQRDHEIDMAELTRKANEKAEERQKVILESILEKNSKAFKTTLEKESEKEEKREKEKTSSQSALFHPLSSTVGDAPLDDLPNDPGNSDVLNR
jgi:hypothetical protein